MRPTVHMEVVTVTDNLMDSYDVAVVGGGPAGLNGALMLGRARRSVLLIDAGEPRSAPAAAVRGFLSRDGFSPTQLTEIGRAEVRRYGGKVIRAQVTLAASTGDGFTVTLDDGQVFGARRLLVTTGLVDELPDIPGVRERWGRDVLHWPYCHGWEVRDQAIGVVATGPMAVHQALLFRQWSANLTLLLHKFAPARLDPNRATFRARHQDHRRKDFIPYVLYATLLSVGARLSPRPSPFGPTPATPAPVSDSGGPRPPAPIGHEPCRNTSGAWSTHLISRGRQANLYYVH